MPPPRPTAPLRGRACVGFVSQVTALPPMVLDRLPRAAARPLRAVLAGTLLGVTAGVACAPRARPLAGVPTAVRLPTAQLPQGHQRVTFRWEYSDADVGFTGEGVARVAAPDSARLDFFLGNGLGGGHAVLVGDSLAVPRGAGEIRRLLPPVPLLWAALGRLALPAAPDTTVRRDGRLLRAEVGRAPRWRVVFDSTRLVELTRIDGQRVAERVTRNANGRVDYQNPGAQRRLTLTNFAAVPAGGFDASIWRP